MGKAKPPTSTSGPAELATLGRRIIMRHTCRAVPKERLSSTIGKLQNGKKIFTGLAIGLFIIACTSSRLDGTANNADGSVERMNDVTIKVTYFNNNFEGGDTVLTVTATDQNYDAYIDMAGGTVAIGETRMIPHSIGRVTMLDSGDLLYEVAESKEPLRPSAREYVKQGTDRHSDLIRMFPDLSPGHFRLITGN